MKKYLIFLLTYFLSAGILFCTKIPDGNITVSIAEEKATQPLSKEEQEKIWNLTRYDGLISDLTANQNKSEDEINNILGNYPEEIHKTALEEQKNNYDLLVQIDKMNKNYNSDFELLLSGYPPEAIDAFRKIIEMPEVLDILFDHMQYTVVVGDYYKKNPERVLHKTDSLNLVLTKKNTQEADDWKQSMNDNPQAQEEYTEAAQEYAQYNGYQPEDYNVPLTQDVTDYNTYPYNWWFGYPWWYPYDYWNPYPYWYDWGFYYGPNRRIVFFGLPSEYFMDWFFYYPEHCSRYAELSNHYYNYYDRHRESRNFNSISHSVNDWRNRNKDIVNADWDQDNSNRIQRFKEYGKMEVDRRKYNTKNPKKQIEQTEYIQKEQRKYPLLSADVSKRQIIQKDSKVKPIQENRSEPVKKPTVTIPDHYKVPVNEQLNNKQSEQNLQRQNNNVQNNNINKQQKPVYPSPQSISTESRQKTQNVIVQPKNPTPVKQIENSNQIRNAQQFHQNTWQQIQPQPQSQPVRQIQQQNSNPPAKQQQIRQVEQPVRQNIQTPPNNKRK
ncbi:MAG: hypothetical protein ABSE72_12775 [Bacteroidales bacterium]